MELRTLSKIALLIFLYYLVYGLYQGIMHPIPAPGDSWDYHIPISRMILNGNFIHPQHVKLPQWYYPGSSEAINALFILFHMPLTLSNLLPILVLFFCLWKLGTVFKLNNYYALLFALSFSSLNVIIRWLNAISVDVWMAVFFSLSLILLEKPQKNISYALKQGFVLGMLLGSKYTGVGFLLVLLIFYFRNIVSFFSFSRFFVFIVPFSIFGLFWYVRNYLLTQNPFYPLMLFGFKGKISFSQTILSATLHHPLQMFNAAFGEYKLWLFVLLAAVIYLFYYLKIIYMSRNFTITGNPLNLGKSLWTKECKFFLLGLVLFLYFLTFPTSDQEWIMVSSFRYSYPVFIPLILGCFVLAKKFKREANLGYFAIANMLLVTSFVYLPKLIIFYLPITCICYYLLYKFEKKLKS